MDRGTAATPRPVSTDATGSSRDAACKRNREDAPLVDALIDLAESRRTDQLVELHLRPAAHHPRAAAMTRETSRDELELRMPRLARVHEEAAGVDGVGEPRE